MKKGLIFDMDGTLWDSSRGVADAWNETVRRLGFRRETITRDDIMHAMGKTMDDFAAAIFPMYGAEERTLLLEACGTYENDYLRIHGGVLYPDLEETLRKLSGICGLYIVSNCQSGYIEAFLDHYGFGRYFGDIECFGNNGFLKKDNIRLLSERNGLDKAYYVGDIQADHDAAVAAGCGFIHAAYGFGTVREDVPVLKSFSALPELLAGIGF